MPNPTVANALKGCFEKPLTKLSQDRRRWAARYIPNWASLSPPDREKRAIEVDRQRAVKLRLGHERASRQVSEAQKDPKLAAEFQNAWAEASRDDLAAAASTGASVDLLTSVSEKPPSRSNADAQSMTATVPDGLTRREKQIRAIEAGVDKLNYTRLAIPDGGKKKIEARCKTDHTDLFGGGGDPFKEAWQAAVSAKPPRIRMKNHDRYSKGK